MRLFALDATRPFGERIAAQLGIELDPHEERPFDDGEHKVRPLTGVEGRDCFVVQSLHGGPDESPNDKLCRLLFFIAALRDHGARRITAVVPYLAYVRKDRRTKRHDPVTIRYVAQLFEAVGTDCVVAMEVHNVAAFENAFRCRTVPLDLRAVFLERAMALFSDDERVVVASPDPGGVKRAQLFGESLEARLGRSVGAAYMEKRRSGGVVSGNLLVGEIKGASLLVVDDLIASGGTLARAAATLKEQGADTVHAVAAHGLFTGDAARSLADPRLSNVFVSDTVPPFRLPERFARDRLQIVPAAPAFAEAIRRLHAGETLADLTHPTE
ncbi:MAG: ribose-phosphate pyrophosphokinase [Hyphomicrobiales bacterium]|nr:ribose-phosphate pyrophosphokinase [Hyphomicrobiales bacterium]